MVESRDKIEKIIKNYIRTLEEHNINIDKVYLFGSYARNTAVEDSDIDIAVVSNNFSGDRFSDRRLVVPLRRKIDRRLEPVPYRTEHFESSDPLVFEILKDGIQIQ